MKSLVSIVTAALVGALPAAAPAQQPEPFGLSVQGFYGGGEIVRDLDTDADQVYGAIVGLHFAGPLALEVEYQHAENELTDLGGSVDQDGLLGHVRLDLSSRTFVPFVYAGLGWVRYSSDAAGFDVEDDRAVVPLGAGLEVQARPLVLGVRGEYQWIPNDLADSDADYWKVVGTAGFRFP